MDIILNIHVPAPCQWGSYPDSHQHKLVINYSMITGNLSVYHFTALLKFILDNTVNSPLRAPPPIKAPPCFLTSSLWVLGRFWPYLSQK